MNAVIHVIDDDEDMRTALARLLRAEGYEVRSYRSAGDFLLAPQPIGPGCILLDLHMPGPSGLELQEALRRQPLPLPVVFLSGRGDVESSVRAMKAGAVDFLTKPAAPEDLLKAVRAALERGASSRAAHDGAGEMLARYHRLTERERAVFDLVVEGKLNKQVADALGITERTVKMHRAQVMAKMQARSVAELVRAADQLKKN